MNTHSTVWIGMVIGTTLGGFIPMLWGAGALSVSSIVFSTLGGIAGVWLGYQLR